MAGCAGPRGPVDQASVEQKWSAHRNALDDYRTWDLYGRAVVRRFNEVYNIGLQWRQEPERFVMLLEAPFGQGVFRIDNSAGGSYRLRLPDGQLFENTTPEALLEDVIGWAMPISGLHYWIRGLPRPDSQYRERLRDSGLARSIRQERWTIEFKDYYDSGGEPILPRRIDLSHDELVIRLVIERWQQTEAEQQDADLFPEFD